jgi:hypothetical protein
MKQTNGGNPNPGLPAAKRNIKLTRRNLLRCGTGIMVAALPPRAWAVGEDVSPVTAELAKYMSEAGSRAISTRCSGERRHRASRRMIWEASTPRTSARRT